MQQQEHPAHSAQQSYESQKDPSAQPWQPTIYQHAETENPNPALNASSDYPPYQSYQEGYREQTSDSWQQQARGEKLVPRKQNRSRAGSIIGFIVFLLLLAVVFNYAIFMGVSTHILFLLPIALILGILFTLRSLSGWISLSETETLQSASIDHPALFINNTVGRISVHAGDVNAVIVQATKRVTGLGGSLKDITVSLNQERGRIQVNVHYHGLSLLVRRLVDLAIIVPYSSDLQIQTGSGEVEIDGISGNASIKTGSGSMFATNIRGQIVMTTGSGEIIATNTEGPMTLTTGSGSILAQGSIGELRLRTGSGKIEVTQADVNGQSFLDTGSGSLIFSGSIDPATQYKCTTGSGSIDLTLSATSAFKLQTSTGSGSVNNEFGGASIGDGMQAEITLRTGSGSISVRKSL